MRNVVESYTFELDDAIKWVPVVNAQTSNMEGKTNAIAPLFIVLISSLMACF